MSLLLSLIRFGIVICFANATLFCEWQSLVVFNMAKLIFEEDTILETHLSYITMHSSPWRCP